MLYKGENLCDYCFRPRGDSKFCPHCGLSEFTYTAESRQLPAGTNLNGHYIVGKVLGQGGFGVTYLAFSAAREGIVAIKEYLPASISYRGKGETNVSLVSANDKELFERGAQRFYEEAKTISQFSGNKNIISVYEFFYANSTVYYSMEYLEGVDLRNYIARKGGTLSESEIISVTLDVCNALRSLHDANILHRDIAPDNIFRCDNGDINLIDFGTAKQVVSNGEQNFSVVVKNGFAPIEQYKRDGNQGPWTDIYALGATMYYALTGEVAPNSFERLESPELSFGGREGAYSPGLVAVIRKCMEVRREDRYQSVYEIIRDLEGINAKESNPAPTPVQPTPTEKPIIPPKAPVVFEEVKKIEEKANVPKPQQKKKGKPIAVIASILVVVLVNLLIFGFLYSKNNHGISKNIETGEFRLANSDDDFVDEINLLIELGVIAGYPDGSFGPTKNVTRAEFARMAYVLSYGTDADSELFAATASEFTDVEGNPNFAWAKGYINYCCNQKIISGFGDTLNPGDNITVTEATKMILVVMGCDPDKEGFNHADWYVSVVTKANEFGLFEGFVGNPNTLATRELVAKLMYNALFSPVYEYSEESEAGSQSNTFGTDYNPTLGEKVFGLKNVEDIVVANEHSARSSDDNGKDCDISRKMGDAKYIMDKGELNIGMTLFAPMNYYDDTNELVGFDTELAKAVCEKIGVTPNFVEINWDTKEIELNAKNIDCIWNGLTIIDERKANMEITDAYMENCQVMVVKKENADKYANSADGAVVAFEAGSFAEEVISYHDFFAHASMVEYPTTSDALMSLSSGSCDIVLVDYLLYANSIGAGTDFEDLTFINSTTFASEQYGVAFRKGSNMVDIVNDALEELKADGTLYAIARKYNLDFLLVD